ncbi:hypothetical protein AC249_AIPGENE11273 [Exaiptasia diaphana]|nr:hypothetical protein AC249_AIPGENE11273 [Exaiptasia diaphana]
MVSILLNRSIPYSIKVAGEYCQVIHNNQVKTCKLCGENGHTFSRCPEVECFDCGEKGHVARLCNNITKGSEPTELPEVNNNSSEIPETEPRPAHEQLHQPPELPITSTDPDINMAEHASAIKRPLSTDEDFQQQHSRRPRLSPTPKPNNDSTPARKTKSQRRAEKKEKKAQQAKTLEDYTADNKETTQA